MSIIGEAVLTASIETLFNKLASSELLKFARQEKIQADLMEWEKILVKIHALLDDAEEKQMTNGLVKSWLADLQNLAFDVEDMLDEFETEVSRRKLLHDEPQPSTSKVQKLIPTCFSSLNPRSVKFNIKMSSEVKKITSRLQNIATVKDRLDLKENSGVRLKKVIERIPTTSLVNEAKVYGRERDKEAIIELLLKDDGDGVSVIPIIGMGGVGKTTLAQLVYNDARVKDHFVTKAWVCVSEDFDLTRITKTILFSVAIPQIDGVNDLNMLQVKLKEELSKKKFLFVLDDVWDENYEKWTVFCSPFEAASPGSKIVVTTRNRGVSLMMKADVEYPLDKLSNDDCLCVFAQHSLGVKDFTAQDQDLRGIGEKIVRRCNGLPLAAKALGGLLRGKSDIKDWKDVLDCKIWDLSEERCNIIPALRVSYFYLPSYLKRCFEFCSLFPKNYEFEEEKIILLWMGIGFLQYETSEKQVEDLGHKYFCELQSRSFFQKSSQDRSLFVMHDLIHDLAQWAGRETYFMVEDTPGIDNQRYVSRTLRHLSYIGSPLDEIEKLGASDVIKQLRTLFVQYRDSSSFTQVICDMLLKPRRLRVLSLQGYFVQELPNSIGDLKHLRYLDLSYTNIESLPESVCALYNLRTLLLEGCEFLRVLCVDMGNLINLRHFNIFKTDSLELMPLRIGKLTGLRTLPKFVVGKGVGSGLAELKSLTHLRERLHISGLENVHDANDAKKADLNGKENLNVLILEWTRSVDDSKQAETKTQVLEMLRPHQNLSELIISGYAGKRFPIWIGDSPCSKLMCLKLKNCRKCISLPSVGQLRFLKDLVIERMDGVESVGPDFYGRGYLVPFISLETLTFSDMKEWKDWIPYGGGQEVQGFPRLRELHIFRCPKLQEIRLPERLPSLEGLRIDECKQLLVSISSSSTLCKLEIVGCKEVVWSTVHLSSLKSVVLSNVSNVLLAERFMQVLPKLKEMTIRNCKILRSFFESGMLLHRDIRSLPQLVTERCPQHVPSVAEIKEEQPPQEFKRCEDLPNPVSLQQVGLSSQLRFITIENCGGLESLPPALMCKSLASLEILRISGCYSLTCIARVQLPQNLNRLEIRGCHELRTLVEEKEVPKMEGSTSGSSSSNTSPLEYLDIGNCLHLTSLWSKGEPPATLRHIKVENCWNLLSLSSRGNLPEALAYLRIKRCPKLESIAQKVHNNTSLESIEIYGCENLKSLPDGMDKLSHLKEISLCSCPSVVQFPEGGLPSTKLTWLNISACEKLVALPNGLKNLTSLQYLSIESCQSIESFPKDGFPTNIKSLKIRIVNICKPLFNWGLHRLTSLRELYIGGGCENVESFPQEEIGMTLPSSLTIMLIEDFPDLVRLSSMAQNLTCLESLSFSFCPRLKYFPENGLPSSLLELNIDNCPQLEENCNEDGQYWPMIAHLPHIRIS